MKLFETRGINPHNNITSWLSEAKSKTISDIKKLLTDESTKDTKWFIINREKHLSQLVDEILTFSLIELSNNSFQPSDFEGHEHVNSISITAKQIYNVVLPFYRKLRVQVISQQLNNSNGEKNEQFGFK